MPEPTVVSIEDVHSYPTAESRARLERLRPGMFVKMLWSDAPFPYNCGWICSVDHVDGQELAIAYYRQYASRVETFAATISMKKFDEQYVLLDSNPFEGVILRSQTMEK